MATKWLLQSDDFFCVRQAVNTFIYRVIVKYMVRTGKREGFGLVGGAPWADVVIARFDFIAPVTRVITVLQCSHSREGKI